MRAFCRQYWPSLAYLALVAGLVTVGIIWRPQ